MTAEIHKLHSDHFDPEQHREKVEKLLEEITEMLDGNQNGVCIDALTGALAELISTNFCERHRAETVLAVIATLTDNVEYVDDKKEGMN
jgi:hypothetical protein